MRYQRHRTRLSSVAAASALTEALRVILFWVIFIVSGCVRLVWVSVRYLVKLFLRLSLTALVHGVLALIITGAIFIVLGSYLIALTEPPFNLP